MFKVDEDKRLDYMVVILWFVVDCFDFVEYAAFDQMLYYAEKYSYDIILNPHVKVVVNKTSMVIHPLVRHSNTLNLNKRRSGFQNWK
jgi:hypothetical protein